MISLLFLSFASAADVEIRTLPPSQPHLTYACPLDSQIPILLYPGKNQFCEFLAEKGGKCPDYATCEKPLGDASVYICCASRCRDVSFGPSCPHHAIPERVGLHEGVVNCTSDPSICSFGYRCTSSEGEPNTWICCRQTAFSMLCKN